MEIPIAIPRILENPRVIEILFKHYCLLTLIVFVLPNSSSVTAFAHPKHIIAIADIVLALIIFNVLWFTTYCSHLARSDYAYFSKLSHPPAESSRRLVLIRRWFSGTLHPLVS